MAPLLFVHKLKKLLEQAMPDTDTADCNQITTPGLQPIDNCEVKELDRTCERAQLLLAMDDQEYRPYKGKSACMGCESLHLEEAYMVILCYTHWYIT